MYKSYIDGQRKRIWIDENNSTMILGTRLYELASGVNETMAIAAGKEGVLEIYNPKLVRKRLDSRYGVAYVSKLQVVVDTLR